MRHVNLCSQIIVDEVDDGKKDAKYEGKEGHMSIIYVKEYNHYMAWISVEAFRKAISPLVGLVEKKRDYGHSVLPMEKTVKELMVASGQGDHPITRSFALRKLKQLYEANRVPQSLREQVGLILIKNPL